MCSEGGVEGVDIKAVLASRSVREFDRLLMLPIEGGTYGHLDAYYRANSSRDWYAHVDVPLLCMESRDDPIIADHLPEIPIAASRSNPNVLAIVTERGGHVGWMTDVGESWAPPVVMSFLEATLGGAAWGGAACPP